MSYAFTFENCLNRKLLIHPYDNEYFVQHENIQTTITSLSSVNQFD